LDICGGCWFATVNCGDGFDSGFFGGSVMSFTITAAADTTFEYKYLSVSDLKVETATNQKTGKKVVKHILVEEEQIDSSDRFWNSLFARYGFNNAFFKYFSHAEVFDRISDTESNDRMRLCIERAAGKSPRLLAVSNPTKPVITFTDLHGILSDAVSQNVSYSNGVVESFHLPRIGSAPFSIAGDDYQNRFVLSCPIDGYGAPNVYLSLLRQICDNGMIGYSKAFRSSISLGKGGDDTIPAISRMLDTFGNEEGYAALRERVEAAQKSWASIHEAWSLQSLLWRYYTRKEVDHLKPEALVETTSVSQYFRNGKDIVAYIGNEEMLGNPIFRAYEAMTGSLLREYGIANMDAFSQKRQRTMPAKCTVYDLMNFATEVATHHAEPVAARALQGWLGECLSNEYDMEGTRDRFTEFKDFHIQSKLVNGVTGSTTAEAAGALAG
jgi:hypothetical protein